MSRGTGQGFKLHHGAGMWWRFSGYLEQIFGKLGFHGGNISGREERGSYKTLARASQGFFQWHQRKETNSKLLKFNLFKRGTQNSRDVISDENIQSSIL